MPTSSQVLRWALDAKTESERDYYWSLYEQVCDRESKRNK
jgi:hypothetical protein